MLKTSTRLIVTGGLGFIGSEVVRQALRAGYSVLNIDAITYAADKRNLIDETKNKNYIFLKADICDYQKIEEAFLNFEPNHVIHLAAESHVDNSLTTPQAFLKTNINGTFNVLEAAKVWFGKSKYNNHRFVHVSTDEVFGSLEGNGVFTIETPYDPRSPYSASKAASDHLVSSWFHSFGLPTIICNTTNNFGPYQHKEKLIPKTINRLLNKEYVPIYGDGKNIRDWIYVKDHVNALFEVLKLGVPGERYLIGAKNEVSNIELVKKICLVFDDITNSQTDSRNLIKFVSDRPGHDFRYSIDPGKIENELNWKPCFDFDAALVETIEWYIRNF